MCYLIEHFEGLEQFIFSDHVFLVHGGHHKLCVVDRPVSVQINFLEHFIDFLFANWNSKHVFVALQDLLFRQVAIAILVQLLEYLFQVLCLFLTTQLTRNESKSGLLEFELRFEVSQVAQSLGSDNFFNFFIRRKCFDPRVLESVLGGDSLRRVVFEESLYEIFRVFAYIVPLRLYK